MESAKHSNLINGLRGLAIALVIGFHFQIPFFHSGFWGVDLFFWISGLLITQKFISEYKLSRETNRKIGNINLKLYFLRRARRILPLSMLVLSAIVLLSYLLKQEFWNQNFYNNVPSILTLRLNFTLQNNLQDYFLTTNQDNMYLHYWTLAVEEQVYFIAPFLFLFAISFHGRKILGYKLNWLQRLLFCYVLLSIISLVYFVWCFQQNSSMIFYSTFARYWEFGIGSVCAVLIELKFLINLSADVKRLLMRFSSLTMVFSILFFKSSTFSPAVIAPLIGISLFTMVANQQSTRSLFSRFLRSSPLQFLGMIAFPLYLIHWPAFILLKNSDYHTNLINLILYLVIVIFLSYVIHIFFEKPILGINLDRFRLGSSSETRSHSLSKSKTLRKSSGVVILISVLILSYLNNPTGAKSQVYSGVNFFASNRYNTIQPEIKNGNEPQIRNKGDAATDTTGDTPTIPSRLNSIEIPESQAGKNLNQTVDTKFLARWMDLTRESAFRETFPDNYDFDQKSVMAEVRKSWSSGCLNSTPDIAACTFGSGGKKVFLIGDSFAFALLDAVKKSMPTGWQLTLLTKGSCLPWDVRQFDKNGILNESCANHNSWVQKFVSENNPDVIIASGADQWLEKSTFQEWQVGFASAAKFYSENSKKLFIVSSTPGAGNLLSCVGSDDSIKSCFGNSKSIEKFVSYQKSFYDLSNYNFINLSSLLCYRSVCPPILNNLPVYGDSNHFSKVFSISFAEVLKAKKIYLLT